MQGEKTERLVCYLSADETTIREGIERDRAGGLVISAIIREALRQYYAPPAPQTDPIQVGILKALAALAESYQKQQEQIDLLYSLTQEHHINQRQVERLEETVQVLRESLTAALYDTKARKEMIQALENENRQQ